MQMSQNSDVDDALSGLRPGASKSARPEDTTERDSEDGRGSKRAQRSGRNLKRDDYEKALRKLHVRLVELQEWIRREKAKICIVFEGRDGAGKGGAIKAITARVSPRIFRV